MNRVPMNRHAEEKPYRQWIVNLPDGTGTVAQVLIELDGDGVTVATRPAPAAVWGPRIEAVSPDA